MAGLVRPAYIVAAKRTAFGSFGGKLKGVTATVLGQHAAEAAMAAGKVDPATVDSSVFGNVIQARVHIYNSNFGSEVVELISFQPGLRRKPFSTELELSQTIETRLLLAT